MTNTSDSATPREDPSGLFLSHPVHWLGCLLALLVFLQGPAASRPAHAADGGALYRRECAPCHGMDGLGNGPNAALFSAKPRNLHEGFLDKYETSELVRRVLDGRKVRIDLDQHALRRHAARTDAVIAHMQRLPSLDWRRLMPAWATYVFRCQSCHGQFGRPEKAREGVKQPRDFSSASFQSAMTDNDLLMAIVHGRSGMPATLPRLSPDEAMALLYFLRQLSPGFEIYTQYCAACHSDNGGGVDFGGADFEPLVAFDEAYFESTPPSELREAVWHMLAMQSPSMPHFRRVLSESDATAIVEFLKAREVLHKQP